MPSALSATTHLTMKIAALFLSLLAVVSPAGAAVRVPASTAYIDPDPNGAKVSKEHGVSAWTNKGNHVLWFGEFKNAGQVQASIVCKTAAGKPLDLELAFEGTKHKALRMAVASKPSHSELST
jgi:hypothetical protein